jgi:hypothetical protein
MIFRPKTFYRKINRAIRQGGFIGHTHWDRAFLGSASTSSGPTAPTADSGLYGWWSSDTGVSLTGGGNLNSWTDRSSNARVATSAGDPNSLHVTSNDINGHQSFKKDESGNTRNVSFPTPAKPFSVVWLMRPDNWVNGGYLHDATNGDACILSGNGSSPSYSMFGGSAFGCTVSLTVGTWYILTCIWNGASSSMQSNNNSAATGSIGTANQGAKIIVGLANDSVCGQWRFAGVIITTSLDGTNLTIHKNWLANYGGLSI